MLSIRHVGGGLDFVQLLARQNGLLVGKAIRHVSGCWQPFKIKIQAKLSYQTSPMKIVSANSRTLKCLLDRCVKTIAESSVTDSLHFYIVAFSMRNSTIAPTSVGCQSCFTNNSFLPLSRNAKFTLEKHFTLHCLPTCRRDFLINYSILILLLFITELR